MSFWQLKDPVTAYLLAFQQFASAPPTGRWDPASHAALYRLANRMNAQISATVPWGGEADKTVQYLVGLVDEADDEVSFQFARPFLVALGFPAMTFEESTKWSENLDSKEAEAITASLKAVAEAVGQAESVASVAPTANIADAQPASPASPDPAASVATAGPSAASVVTPTPAAPAATIPPTVVITPVPGVTSGVPVAQFGMTKKTKVILGVVGAVATVTIGALAYKAFSKSKAPAMNGLDEFDDDMGAFGDYGCAGNKRKR